LLPTVGEVLGVHWTATAHLKLDSPQSVSCCTATIAPGNNETQKETNYKTGKLKCPDNGGHCHSENRHDISDSKKTAVINNELRDSTQT